MSCLLLAPPARALAGPAQAALERVNDEVAAELGDKAAAFWRALRQIGNVAAPASPPAPARSAKAKAAPTAARKAARKAAPGAAPKAAQRTPRAANARVQRPPVRSR